MHTRRLRVAIATAVAGAVVLALAGDRLAANLAATMVASRAACAAGLSSPPSVSVGRFPFLTQVLAGRYDDVEVSARNVRLGDLVARTVDAGLHDVTLPDPGHVRIGRVTADVTVAYSALPSRVAGQPVTFAGANGLLAIGTTVSLAGHQVPVTVLALPQVTGDSLAIVPREVDVLGIRRPIGGALDRLFPAADLTQGLPKLPNGLHYRSASATADGLRVTLEGTDVTAPIGTCVRPG